MSERKDSSSTTKSNNNSVEETHAFINSQSEIQHSNNTNNKNNNNNSIPKDLTKRVPLMLQMTPIASENNRLTIHGTYAFEPPRQGHVAVDAIRILMGNTSAGKALLSEEIKKSGFHEKKTWPRPPSTSDSAEMLALHRSNSNNNNNNNLSAMGRSRPQTSTNSSRKQPKTPQNAVGNGNSTARSMRSEQARLSQWSGTHNNNNIDENQQIPSRLKNPKLEMPDIPSEKVKKLKAQEELEASISVLGCENNHSIINNNTASLVASTSTASPNKNISKESRNCPKLFQNCVADSSALIYSAAVSNNNTENNNSNNNNSQNSQQKLPPSRVPRQYWITREHAVPQTVAQSEEHGGGVKTNFEMVSIPIFPSEKPISRMELFALSKTLDEMMAIRVGAAGFDLLQNAEAALSTFSETRGVEDVQGALQKTKDYIETVKTVSDIVDVGLCEVVRHTAAGCIERGALLDQLRGMLVAMFGNLCDRAENDMSRMGLLRSEIHEAEKERDLARQEASNWRRLFFKVNSIGGTSSTKGVTGLLGDPNANPRNLLLLRRTQQNNNDDHESDGNFLDENKNAVVMPSEEECREKSFDEVQDEVYRRLDNAAAEEKRVFEEKQRQKEIAKERRRKEEELWEAAARRPSGVFDDDEDEENNRNNYQEAEDENRKVSPSRRVSFQVQQQQQQSTSQQSQQQMSNRRRSVTISSTLSPSSSDFQQQQNNNSLAPSRRDSSSSVALCKAPQTSRTFGILHQHQNKNRFANFKNENDDQDEDEDEDDENGASRGRKIDAVDLERDAVFQWIEEQFAKRSYAARDLALAAEKHLEIIRRHETASLTSALGDMPIEDDADALEAELAQQPKSIYQVLVNLLTDVHSAVVATDNLSSRMALDGLHLKHPERNINVAVRRWRRLAQEIGRFRSENGRRIPIENLKVEFAQLPNPSVVDILFTLVEISSTLSELSLRLKANANAKILDRVTVDPPVAPERPQDPCPLCFRTAPPPASWGKQKGHHHHHHQQHQNSINTNNLLNGDVNFENVMIHSESSSTALSHQQLQLLQNNNNNNNNNINNLIPNSTSSSLAAHHAVGDVISNLGLEKFDTTHQNYLKSKDPPLVIELKINCSCCKGGTIVNNKIASDFDKLRRSMMTEEEKEKRRERKQKNRKKRKRLQRRKSKRRKNGMEDFSDAESFFDSSCGSDDFGDDSSADDSADSSSMSSISPSSSSSGRSGNKSRNRRRSERKKQKLLQQQQKAQAGLIVAKKRYEKGKSRSRRGSGEGDYADSEYQPSNYNNNSANNTTNGNLTSRPSQILLRKNNKKRSNSNNNKNNNNNNDEDDDYDDDDLKEDRTLSKKEMKELARELAEEEEKAADVLKSKLLGATSLPGFLRQGSFNLGGEDSSLVISSSRIRRKESTMTDYFPSAPPAMASSVHTASPTIKPYNNQQQQQQQQQQKDNKKENYARKQSSTSLLSANRQVSRKYSMFSEYSEKGGAPPSVSGTTRPDSPTSRRASIFSDLSRKNSRMNLQRAPSRPDNSSGNNLAHRKSTTIKATRSFLGEGGYQDNNNNNETNLTIPTLPSISNNNNNKKLELPRALQTTVSGDGGTGFIANARQKYKLFSETRSAKLLFLVGMELNTREEEERQLLSANDPTRNLADNNNSKTNKSKQSFASKQQQLRQQQQQNGDSTYYCWPLELLLQNIHECYEFFLQNGHGKANDLGEFIAGAAAQREKLSVSLKPATMMESCQEHQSDERVNNFVEHVIGHTSCVTLRMILQARDKLRLHQTQKLIDVDTELPAKVQVTKALRVSAETFDFANNVFQSLKEDLLRNCLPRLSATDIQVLLNNPANNNNNNSKGGANAGAKNDTNAVLGAALETALADRFVPLHLVHTIWRELLMEQSAMFKDEFLMEVM